MHSSKALSKMASTKRYDPDGFTPRDERRHPDAKRSDQQRAEARRSKRDWEM